MNVVEVLSETWVSRLIPSPLRRRVARVAGRGKYDKWRRWLDGTDDETNGKITNEVIAMHARRTPWREITELEKGDGLPSPGAYWWEWVVDCYVVTQSIAIRRQLDQGPNALSLGRMLREMVDHPGVVTRELWLSNWSTQNDEHQAWIANKQWDENFAGKADPDVLDPDRVAADLQALVDGGAKMRGYVNRHIAHVDRRGSKTLPTYGDIDEAVDFIGSLFRRYYGLMMAASWTQLEPSFQHDWAAPLRTAWLPPLGGD